MEGDVVSIKAFFKGKPAERVKENADVLFQINNRGTAINKPSIWFGSELVWSSEQIEGFTTRDIPIDVGEYIGNIDVKLKDGAGRFIGNSVTFTIEPKSLSYEEFRKIRHERIPFLLKKLGAENIQNIIYKGGPIKTEVEFIEYSIDELLNRYSQELIDVSKEIMKRLTYKSRKEVRKFKSEIKGKIKWQKTLRLRQQKGLSHYTTHVCERRLRTYRTPANLLLLKFHSEIFAEGVIFLSRLQQREIEKIRWKKIYGQEATDYDPHAVELLSGLRRVLPIHKLFLTQEKFRDFLHEIRYISRDDPLLIRNAEQEASRAKNRSYKSFMELYKDFIANFQPQYVKNVVVDEHKMSDMYRLWAVCEMANALDLRSIARSMREFKNNEDTIYLYYQKIESIYHPWSDIPEDSSFTMKGGEETEDPSFIGPEVYVIYEGKDVLVHTIYGDFKGGLPKEKVYEAMAYMNDYDFKVGIVLYSGKRFNIRYDVLHVDDPKVLIEAPLLPRVTDDESKSKKRSDYLRYLAWAAVILHRAAERKDDLAPAVKSITKTIKVKYLSKHF
jgi:hypothetical protein